jgi:hypothetical protein
MNRIRIRIRMKNKNYDLVFKGPLSLNAQLLILQSCMVSSLSQLSEHLCSLNDQCHIMLLLRIMTEGSGFDCALAFEASKVTGAVRLFPHLANGVFFQVQFTDLSKKLKF